MRCPWRYRWHKSGKTIASDFIFWMMERDAAAEAAFNAKYPTCWDKFLHWLGWRG